MKLDTFFNKFEELVNTLGAIAKVRELVLQLAVQGRLVGQSANDEPAETLAAKIAGDRAEFVKTRGLARQRVFEAITEDQFPFDLPVGWEWTRLGNLCRVQAGFAFESSSFVQGDTGVPMIRIRDITKDRTQVNYAGEYRDEFLVDAGDYLVGMDGNFTVAKWRGPRALLNQRVSRLQWYSSQLEPSFFAIAVQHRLSELQGTKAYTTVDHLSSGQIENAVVPLPPLAEQKRIVAKVDGLMTLCDRLEAQKQERESRLAVLARASLARFADAPTRANLQLIFHKSYDIPPSDLRKSILTLAVQGKLVPQDSTDEPAETLLNQIRGDLQAQKKNSKTDPNEVAEDELPHDVPFGWCWSSVQELAQPNESVTYGILKPVWVESGVPTVRVTEMKTGVIDVAALPRCDPQRAAKFSKTTLNEGDLLISKDGTIGKTAFVPRELVGGNITQHMLRFAISKRIDRDFIRLCIDAPPCQEWMVGETKGVALQGVNVGDFRRMPLPVPPLPEQRRIVAKVNQLMSLVDDLEVQISVSIVTGSKLMEAFVSELTSEV